MTLTPGFHPEAREEFFAAIEWYDERQVGLGDRLGAAVQAALATCLLWPEAAPAWPGWEREPTVRSRPISGFPYRLVYFVSGEELTVVAVAHGKRRPGFWRYRT